MTELQAIEAVYQRWKDGWELLHPRNAGGYPNVANDPLFVPYALDDEDFQPIPGTLGLLGCWATVVVRHSTRDQTTQGSPSRDDVIGNVFVQLFGPKNIGVARLVALAHDVRTVLAKKSIDDLELREGRTNEGTKKDAAWAMRVVVVPFTYTEQS